MIALFSVILFALTYALQAWLTPWRKYERAQERQR